MGTAQVKVRRSDTICVIWMPRRPSVEDRIRTRGMKKTPWRAIARKVAGTVRPIVWSIMLLIMIQAWQQKVTH